jgi:hypothetical protein
MTTLNKKTLLAIAGLMAMAALTALAWAAPNQDFQITSLRPNTVVPGEVLELSGTGADSQGTVQVEVLTNQW